MFAGGIADKVGNRYEAKWLVRQLIRVLYGERQWIRFEGITNEFDGFEFALGADDSVEWHQTKKSSPNGNWTIRALEREGVLAAFRRRLSDTDTDTCHFISEDPAKDARALAQKAGIANDAGEFEGGLSEDQSRAFTDLCAFWAVDKTEGWQWLRRCAFQVESTSGLDSHIAIISQHAFENVDGQRVFEMLRDYMERRFNDQISTEALRQDLRTHEYLNFKDWSLDPTLKERLVQETQAYLATYSPFGAGGETIERKEAQQISDALLNPRASQIALVTGVAGSGKSGVIRQLIKLLHEAGVSHLAFRVDHYLDCQRPEDFGEAILQRRERPTVTLKGVAPSEPAVLIIDQVDAVSEVSGRNGAVRNAVLSMLEGLYALRTVRVVLVCRNYDFDNDPRLKSLRDSHRENRFDIPLLDWDSEIAPLVATKGYKAEQFTSAQRDLLRLPLNLAVYLEVAERELSFTSRDDLFRGLIRKKERALRQSRNVVWSLMQVMETLAEWMSERQRLAAPENILDGFPEAQDILSSEGLIVASRGDINFFHESFFDFAYAQSFARSSRSLYEMLVSSEQHLFRRTQCRQILEVMRQGDMPRYLEALSKILFSDDIRYHIKLAISQWLGMLPDPTGAERDVALKLDNPTEPFSTLAESALFRSAGWFDLHIAHGWLQQLLNDTVEKRRNVAFWSVLNVASDRPSEVAKLLRNWWGDNHERTGVLFGWLANFRRVAPNADLARLCEDVIRSKPLGLFSEASQDRREMILVTWGEENGAYGARLLKAFFDTWFDLHPGQHPFQHDRVQTIDLYSMDRLREKAPVGFLEATLDAFKRSLNIIREKKASGEWASAFERRTYSGHFIADNEFLRQLRAAMRTVAEDDPAQALTFLNQLSPDLHTVCLHVHLDTVLGNPAALKDHFISLLTEEELFEAGWDGAEWKSFADAAASVFPLLNPDEKYAVEQTIFAQRPEYGRATRIVKEIIEKGESDAFYTRSHVIYSLNRSGFDQWCVLKTIGCNHLTATANRQFQMLDRKFPRASVPRPRHNEAYFVGSPIKFEHAAHMSDGHWLKAIKTRST
jgi:hypothetical protein